MNHQTMLKYIQIENFLVDKLFAKIIILSLFGTEYGK